MLVAGKYIRIHSRVTVPHVIPTELVVGTVPKAAPAAGAGNDGMKVLTGDALDDGRAPAVG